MKQWVVLCMLATVAFSGCLGFLEDDATTDASPDATDGMEGNETVNATNTAPAIEAFAANQTEGEVPFDVRFEWNASDADGDNLTWTLDADGDGEAETNGTGAVLPFNFTFTYDSAGAFNATLNVTDGSNATVSVVTINATEPQEEGGEGGEEGQEPFTPIEETAMIVAPCAHCTQVGDPSPSVGWNAGVSGVETVWVELPENAAGQPFEVTSDGVPFGDPDVVFMSACSSDATAMATHLNAGPESGKVPAGAGCLVAWEWVGNPGTTITITVG